MIRALVAGVLARPPEQRRSRADKPYLILTIREGAGEKARLLSAFIFADEAREAAAAIATGDAIALAGEIDGEVYARDGSAPRISWSLRADGPDGEQRRAETNRRRAASRNPKTGRPG
jgi:hypothetical protein